MLKFGTKISHGQLLNVKISQDQLKHWVNYWGKLNQFECFAILLILITTIKDNQAANSKITSKLPFSIIMGPSFLLVKAGDPVT
jgi:hypothetical protein